MKKRLIAFALALVGTVALGDELLDAVLLWDKPVGGWTKTEGTRKKSTGQPESWRRASDEEEKAWQLLNGEQQQEEEIETTLREDAEVEETDKPEANNDEDDSDDRRAAGMERSSRITIIGGGGSDDALAVSGEWTMPLGHTTFDLSLKGFYLGGEYKVRKSYRETYYTYTHWYSFWSGWHTVSHRHTRTVWYSTMEDFSNYGGEALLIWRPFRGRMLSPFAGVGARIERMEQWEKDDEEDVSVAGCAGLSLNIGRFMLNGEVRGGQSSWELMGRTALRVGRHIALNVFATHFEADKHEGEAFGGGLTWVF